MEGCTSDAGPHATMPIPPMSITCVDVARRHRGCRGDIAQRCVRHGRGPVRVSTRDLRTVLVAHV